MYEVGAIATTVTSLALVSVGTIIGISQLRRGKASVSGAWFFVVTCLFLALWLLANTLSDVDTGRALLWIRVSFASVAIALTSLLLFVNRFPTRRFVSRTETVLPVAILGLMLGLIASPFVIPTITFENGVSTVIPGMLYGAFVIHVVGVLGVTLLRLFLGTRLQKQYRAQVQLILAGVIVTAAVALAMNLIVPLIVGNNNLYWLASVSTLAFVVATAFAITKEGLFDVRQAVTRSVVYVGSLVTIITVYYGVVFLVFHTILQDRELIETAVSPLALVPALIFALTFQPVKQFFDKLTNRYFFRGSYKSEEFFTEFGQLLASTTDLRSLLEHASTRIAATFKAEQAFFHLYYTHEPHYHMSAGTRHHASLPKQDAEMLAHYIHLTKATIILTELITDRKVQRMLRSHKVALVMPLGHDNQIVGYLMLGEHLGSYYTKRDLTVLMSVSDELVIAVQNAISIHEVKELNATLQQRIDVATKELRSSNAQLKHLDEVKDEFMSMASHQLRTPLTSIKGYLSMVLDGDVGKITPQQEKVLAEAFNSSERMVHLIADFLNVSRLQTGKFVIEKSVIDFNALVEQEIEDLRVMAKGRSLELVLKLPKTKFLINADAAKLREVITNFVDNAIYYSRVGTKIAIRVKQDGDALLFTVTDTGIGVPKNEQSKVFGKFFRATNARKQRPDGTGVGLYLARKVITAHGGKEIFESVEGKGSIFGFRIPLAVLPNSANDTNDDHNERQANTDSNQ